MRLGPVALVPLLVIGCTNRVHVAYAPDASATVSGHRRVEPVFASPDTAAPVDLTELAERGTTHHTVHRLRMRSIGENGQEGNHLTALYYRSRAAGAVPLVIVLPIWGSYTYPPEKITAAILKRSRGGCNVLRILGEDYLFDWDALAAAPDEGVFLDLMARMAERLRSNVVDVSRLVDWAEQQLDVDANRIGLIGFSVGGVTAGLVAINEPRLAAHVIVMGGAHPHRILATCFGRSARVRDSVLARTGWTVEDYELALEPVYRSCDAASYPGRVDPSRILVVDAAHDTCVPEDARLALWEALGRPERITIGYSHKSSFLAMTPLGFNWLRRSVVDFLDRRLDIDGSR